jgi:hypothetical protein
MSAYSQKQTLDEGVKSTLISTHHFMGGEE